MYLFVHDFAIQDLEGIQVNTLKERENGVADGGVVSQTQILLRGARGRSWVTIPVLALSELLVHLYADHLGILYQQLLDQFTYVERQVHFLRISIYINLCHINLSLNLGAKVRRKKRRHNPKGRVNRVPYQGYAECHEHAIVGVPKPPYLCTQNSNVFFMAEQKKLSIIAFSGDFDKLTAVFTLGTGAAAVGYEVNIFFTFWGLDAIKQKQGRSFTGGNWLTKLFGFMMGGLKVTPTSRFNFLGAGPKIFRYLMRKNNVATLEELVEAAKALGINLYACEMAMHVLGLKKEDFIPEIKDVLGVASFLNLSEGGQTLFI